MPSVAAITEIGSAVARTSAAIAYEKIARPRPTTLDRGSAIAGCADNRMAYRRTVFEDAGRTGGTFHARPEKRRHIGPPNPRGNLQRRG